MTKSKSKSNESAVTAVKFPPKVGKYIPRLYAAFDKAVYGVALYATSGGISPKEHHKLRAGDLVMIRRLHNPFSYEPRVVVQPYLPELFSCRALSLEEGLPKGRQAGVIWPEDVHLVVGNLITALRSSSSGAITGVYDALKELSKPAEWQHELAEETVNLSADRPTKLIKHLHAVVNDLEVRFDRHLRKFNSGGRGQIGSRPPKDVILEAIDLTITEAVTHELQCEIVNAVCAKRPKKQHRR